MYQVFLCCKYCPGYSSGIPSGESWLGSTTSSPDSLYHLFLSLLTWNQGKSSLLQGRFLNLGTIDVLGWVGLCWGHREWMFLYIVGCLALSLVSTCQVPVALLPCPPVIIESVCRCCHLSPGEQDHIWLKSTGLKSEGEKVVSLHLPSSLGSSGFSLL